MSNNIYFTPGPSQLFFTFEDHFKKALALDIPSISHRSKAFISVVKDTTIALRELLSLPEDQHVFYLSSANEAWDRIIQNLVMKSSHHFINGSFSQKFYDFAIAHGMQSTFSKAADGQAFENLDVPETAELVGVTKNETSVGFSFTPEEISQIRANNPEKLIALDIVSASPAVQVDFGMVDTAYFSVQKAFGLPAGLGVWIANDRCLEKASEKAQHTSLGSYRSLPNLKKFADKDQTPETPNMLYIYLLGKIAEDLLKYGVQKVQNDTLYKATLIKQTVENHPLLSHFVASAQNRSQTTIVAKAEKQEVLLTGLAKKGLVVGNGYSSYKASHIRIANFPTHSKEAVELLCDEINKVE